MNRLQTALTSVAIGVFSSASLGTTLDIPVDAGSCVTVTWEHPSYAGARSITDGSEADLDGVLDGVVRVEVPSAVAGTTLGVLSVQGGRLQYSERRVGASDPEPLWREAARPVRSDANASVDGGPVPSLGVLVGSAGIVLLPVLGRFWSGG